VIARLLVPSSMQNCAQHTRSRKLLNRFSHRSIGVFAFCWLRRGPSGKVKAKKCKIRRSTDVQIDSQLSPEKPRSSRYVASFEQCGFPYFRMRICFQSWDSASQHGICAISLTAQNGYALLSVGPHPRRKPRDKAGSSWPSSFLTKPKQLIKFDLIVSISRESPGADENEERL
jgi:hypothetical protein